MLGGPGARKLDTRLGIFRSMSAHFHEVAVSVGGGGGQPSRRQPRFRGPRSQEVNSWVELGGAE